MRAASDWPAARKIATDGKRFVARQGNALGSMMAQAAARMPARKKVHINATLNQNSPSRSPL